MLNMEVEKLLAITAMTPMLPPFWLVLAGIAVI